MSLFSKLFGAKGQAKSALPEPELYKGYAIFPEPINEPGGYRIGARIEKEVGGELLTHMMIRADTYSMEDAANEASIMKAKQAIDQMGDRIFG